MINKLFRRLSKPETVNEKTSLRIIKTARTAEAINEATGKGFWPLVRPVTQSPYISSKFAVFQDEKTGRIHVSADYRDTGEPNMKTVIDFMHYYPYNFPSPFAAYLIPKDIKEGEHVILEDLIEDVVGSSWNQGSAYRLKSCEAVWDGKTFVLQHDSSKVVGVVG